MLETQRLGPCWPLWESLVEPQMLACPPHHPTPHSGCSQVPSDLMADDQPPRRGPGSPLTPGRPPGRRGSRLAEGYTKDQNKPHNRDPAWKSLFQSLALVLVLGLPLPQLPGWGCSGLCHLILQSLLYSYIRRICLICARMHIITDHEVTKLHKNAAY